MDTLTDTLLADDSAIRSYAESEVDFEDHDVSDLEDDVSDLGVDVSDLRDELLSQIALEKAVGVLRHLIARDPLAADMKLSLFASSVFSYRWTKTANPLPPGYGDYGSQAAIEALRSLPAVRQMLTEDDVLQHTPSTSLRLLQWLLGDPGGVTLRALPRPSPAADQPLPDFTFEVNNPSLAEKWQSVCHDKTIVTCFLGQPLDIYHSIVHLGLPVGETPMKLRRDMAAAIQDSSPGYGLRCSELGTPLLCVAECHCAMVLPGATPWHNASGSYLLLYDGRLALVTRIYAFKGGFLKETLSRKDRATSSFKLPQFKFEITHQSAPTVCTTPARLTHSRPLFLNPLTITSSTSQAYYKSEPKSKYKPKYKSKVKPKSKPENKIEIEANTNPKSETNSELGTITTTSQPTTLPLHGTLMDYEPNIKKELSQDAEVKPEPAVENNSKFSYPHSSSKFELEVIVHAPSEWLSTEQSTYSIVESESIPESSLASTLVTAAKSTNGETDYVHPPDKAEKKFSIYKPINLVYDQVNSLLKNVVFILTLMWIQLRYMRRMITLNLWQMLVIVHLLTGGV